MKSIPTAALAGHILFWAAGAALAEAPDWLPAAIDLPDPHEVVQERSIGTAIHMMTLAVQEDPAPRLEDWNTALRNSGFDTDTTMISENRLLFSGPNDVDGQIATSKSAAGPGYEIDIEVSGGG